VAIPDDTALLLHGYASGIYSHRPKAAVERPIS
jgi:hypothetical protein